MVHSKQFVVEYILSVVGHQLSNSRFRVTDLLGKCAFLHSSNE